MKFNVNDAEFYQHGIAPLGPPAPVQPLLLGRGVGPPGRP